MAEPGSGWEGVHRAVTGVVRPGTTVVATLLRPRPLADVSGRSVAYFSTAPEAAHAVLAEHLEEIHGARVVHVSAETRDT
jgi:predicted GTPase